MPNLDRIPSKGDPRASQFLGRTPHIVDAAFLGSISVDLALDLGRYGIRRTTIALRRGSIEVLAEALLAISLGATGDSGDPRDLMVGLALPHTVARDLAAEPAVVFSEVAARVARAPIAHLLVEFGAREDVDLASFGWARVETPGGPDFVPA